MGLFPQCFVFGGPLSTPLLFSCESFQRIVRAFRRPPPFQRGPCSFLGRVIPQKLVFLSHPPPVFLFLRHGLAPPDTPPPPPDFPGKSLTKAQVPIPPPSHKFEFLPRAHDPGPVLSYHSSLPFAFTGPNCFYQSSSSEFFFCSFPQPRFLAELGGA